MAINENIKNKKFSDYIYVLFKWKKLLIINLLLITGLGVLYSFVIPEQFKGTSTVMVSQNDQQSIGGLGSFLSGDLMSLSSQILGGSNPSFDLILGILNSRTALTEAINDFELMEYYEIDDKNIDKALLAFRNDLFFQPTENSLIEVSVVNKDPKLAAKMANYFVNLADSLYIQLNIEQARNNRIFIEKRYKKNIADLKAAEDSFYLFQKKYGVAAIPEQLEGNIKVAAEIETELIKKELAAEILKNQFGAKYPQYNITLNEVEALRKKVDELKNSKSLYKKSNILFPFKDVPDISIKYYRNFREIEIQNKILEFVLPLYEQALVEEQKSTPNLLVIDKAVPPALKYSPKKALIILMFFFLGLFMHLPFIFWYDRLISSEHLSNPLEEKGKRFAQKLSGLYRINLSRS